MLALELIVPNKTEKPINKKAPVLNKKGQAATVTLYQLIKWDSTGEQRLWKKEIITLHKNKAIKSDQWPIYCRTGLPAAKIPDALWSSCSSDPPTFPEQQQGSIREMDHPSSASCACSWSCLNPFCTHGPVCFHGILGDTSTHKYLQLFVIHFRTILVSSISSHWLTTPWVTAAVAAIKYLMLENRIGKAYIYTYSCHVNSWTWASRQQSPYIDNMPTIWEAHSPGPACLVLFGPLKPRFLTCSCPAGKLSKSEHPLMPSNILWTSS